MTPPTVEPPPQVRRDERPGGSDGGDRVAYLKVSEFGRAHYTKGLTSPSEHDLPTPKELTSSERSSIVLANRSIPHGTR
jgi:hypothetical protein